MIRSLIFGHPYSIVQNIGEYLGNTIKSQRSQIVYFEFPNPKFDHPKIRETFDRMIFYQVQQSMISSKGR